MSKLIDNANVLSGDAACVKGGDQKTGDHQVALYTCAYEGYAKKSTPSDNGPKQPTPAEMADIKHEAGDVAKGKFGAKSIKQFEHLFNETSREPNIAAHGIGIKLQDRIDEIDKECAKEGITTNRIKLDLHYNKDTGKAEYDVYLVDGDNLPPNAQPQFPKYDRLLGPSVIRIGVFSNKFTKDEFLHPPLPTGIPSGPGSALRV
jgi:hypothetical protein